MARGLVYSPLEGIMAHKSAWRNGRRAGFRIQWGNPWRFESSRRHQTVGSGRAGGQAGMAERQTLRSQKPFPARGWGFESPSRHQHLLTGLVACTRRAESEHAETGPEAGFRCPEFVRGRDLEHAPAPVAAAEPAPRDPAHDG